MMRTKIKIEDAKSKAEIIIATPLNTSSSVAALAIILITNCAPRFATEAVRMSHEKFNVIGGKLSSTTNNFSLSRGGGMRKWRSL